MDNPLLEEVRKAIASGALSPRQLEKTVADAGKDRREYVRRMPERILQAFTYAVDDAGNTLPEGDTESNVKFRRNPETGEIVIHTSSRHAHALLYAQALRREHDAKLLKFDVKSQEDPKIKDGWHYRIAISGDDPKSLERVYKSLQILAQHQERFIEYGQPAVPIKKTDTKPPTPKVEVKPSAPKVESKPVTPEPIKTAPQPAPKKPEPEQKKSGFGWGWKKAATTMAAGLVGLSTLFSLGRKDEGVAEAVKPPVAVPEQKEDLQQLMDVMVERFWNENHNEVKTTADGKNRLMDADDLKDEIMKLYGADIGRWHQEYQNGKSQTRGGYKPTSSDDYILYKLTEATHRDPLRTKWWHEVGGDHPSAHSKPQGRGGR